MTLLVDLLPEIEACIHEAAEAEGTDAAARVRDAMAASHPFPVAPTSMTENNLWKKSAGAFPKRSGSGFVTLSAAAKRKQ